jgi:peptidoglycan/xylan/chitin deacetylase (PgdA/CDA1 family)
MYHRVVEREDRRDGDRFVTSVRRLRRHLTWLSRLAYSAVPLTSLLGQPAGPGKRHLAVTFDDGYADTLELALPVLEAHATACTVFIVTDCIGGHSRWLEAPHRLLSREQILLLHQAGVAIGSHARTHRRLTQLPDAELWSEVADSKACLEDLLGARVDAFSYPHNDADPRVMEAARKAGYRLAVGGNKLPHQAHHLHRIDSAQLNHLQLLVQVSGVHRWARRQPLPKPLRAAVRRLL